MQSAALSMKRNFREVQRNAKVLRQIFECRFIPGQYLEDQRCIFAVAVGGPLEESLYGNAQNDWWDEFFKRCREQGVAIESTENYQTKLTIYNQMKPHFQFEGEEGGRDQ